MGLLGGVCGHRKRCFHWGSDADIWIPGHHPHTHFWLKRRTLPLNIASGCASTVRSEFKVKYHHSANLRDSHCWSF